MVVAALSTCALIVLAACSSSTRPCTNFGSVGMSVTVLRASNQAGVSGAKVIIRDGDYEEELHGYQGGNRVGTYRVEVTHRDYVPAVVEGVVVTRNECHYDTTQVTVALEGGPADTFP